MEEAIKKADVLIEALPYIKNFRHKTFVFKYGGSILGEESIRRSVLEDLVFLSFMGIKTVLVHGGGPNISDKMRKIGKKTEFVDGMRVTDAQTLQVAQIGGSVVGLSGKDHGILRAQKMPSKVDMGFVGVVSGVAADEVDKELKNHALAVIAPMGVDEKGVVYNINADEAASKIAAALGAEKFVLLTNVRGVMREPEDPDSLMGSLHLKDIKSLITQKVIQAGMIPKVNACIDALKGGVKKTHIIDARIPHATLLEIFTDMGIGTEIVK